MNLTWIGRFDGIGAYPTINRGICDALERRGHTILRNRHNDGTLIPDVAVQCMYPPQPLNFEHKVNIAWNTWEFEQLPDVFIDSLSHFDLTVVMSEWVRGVYEDNGVKPVTVIMPGVDPKEFKPRKRKMGWSEELRGKKKVFWTGGTDKRHGLDIALEVGKQLPEKYKLLTHQYSNYPKQDLKNLGYVMDIQNEILDMGSWLNEMDCLLFTARAIGFGLPVLEAMATGLPIIALDNPVLREYATGTTFVATLETGREPHHIHPEVPIQWVDTSPQKIVEAIVDRLEQPPPIPVFRSWDDVAQEWENLLWEWI